MGKILTKILSIFVTLLMIFSTSFNLISYAVSDNTVEIWSNQGKIKLIVYQDLVDKYGEGAIRNWISRYDTYYNQLASLIGNDPISRGIVNHITIDSTSFDYTNHGGAAAYTYANSLKIVVRPDYVEEVLIYLKDNRNVDVSSLMHELGHTFQHISNEIKYDWCFQGEVWAIFSNEYLYKKSDCTQLLSYATYRYYTY